MRNKVRRTDTGVTVDFTGPLVNDERAKLYQWMGMDHICPGDITDAIGMAGGRPLTLRMNSPGGDLHAGVEMYTRLMDYPGQVTVDILSISASASSVVAMVSAKQGNRCRVSPLGMMVIHNVQTKAEGDYREMESTAQHLRQANSAIITAYRKKTGMEEAQLQEMLDKETWLTAGDAIKMGFADEVMFEEGEPQADDRTVTAVMARTRELVNAIPSFDQETIQRVLEAKHQEDAAKDMEDQFQAAARLLELEQNRF